jgi:hypothetical protein
MNSIGQADAKIWFQRGNTLLEIVRATSHEPHGSSRPFTFIGLENGRAVAEGDSRFEVAARLLHRSRAIVWPHLPPPELSSLAAVASARYFPSNLKDRFMARPEPPTTPAPPAPPSDVDGEGEETLCGLGGGGRNACAGRRDDFESPAPHEATSPLTRLHWRPMALVQRH